MAGAGLRALLSFWGVDSLVVSTFLLETLLFWFTLAGDAVRLMCPFCVVLVSSSATFFGISAAFVLAGLALRFALTGVVGIGVGVAADFEAS